MAALIIEAYCLLEFRDDMITVMGVGIVLLISAYLLMDSIKACYNSEMKKIDEKINLFAKLQKALYVTAKKQIDLMEQDNQDETIHEMIDVLNHIKEEESKLTKILIKYNREDTKYIVAKNRADAEKVVHAIQQLSSKMADEISVVSKGVSAVNQGLETANQNILSKMDEIKFTEIVKEQETKVEPAYSAEDNLTWQEDIQPEDENQKEDEHVIAEETAQLEEEDTIEDIIHEEVIPEEDTIEEMMNEEILPESESIITEVDSQPESEESVIIEEEIQPEDENTIVDEAAQLEENDVMALDDSFMASESIDLSEYNLLEDDNAVTENIEETQIKNDATEVEMKKEEMVQEEAPTATAVETPVDPNKPLSPDEIAALFASIG
jgi:AAA ATPase containing von Willebrand factor type A (vWA) domain